MEKDDAQPELTPWELYAKETGAPDVFKPIFERYGKEVYELSKILSNANSAHYVIKDIMVKHQSRAGITALDILGRAVANMLNYRLETLGITPEIVAACADEGLKASKELKERSVGGRILRPH